MLLCGAMFAQDSEKIRVVRPDTRPADAVVLFDGTALTHWATDNGNTPKCEIATGAMTCATGVGNIFSKDKFGSAQIHLEFNIPSMPDQHGQMRGNSGVYLHGRYEIQLLDSFHNPTYANGMCGALYGQTPPLVNAARPPGEWQTYDIVFHAPQCGANGDLTRRGSVTLLWNGILALDNVQIEDKEHTCAHDHIGDPGPLMLQDHNGPGAPVTRMRFRNIWYRPIGN
jgi:hypothetical protein